MNTTIALQYLAALFTLPSAVQTKSNILAIAVAAAELIISHTTSSAAVKALARANAGNTLWYLRTGSPLVKHRFARSQSGDVKAAWNLAAIRTGYASAVIK